MNIKRRLIASGYFFLLLACQPNDGLKANDLNKDSTMNAQVSDKQVQMKGTIQYISLEGGFYGIVTENGQKLLPMNLDKAFMQDGAIIEFSGKMESGMMTIQQWGKPFKITEIKLIKAGKANSKQEF
ncbi:hypothetical protein [Aliikangiella sp. G2MR2-5]|uniref:hypothetical protein n=1 Tax=Aliikangiella sp. G2MR2-5 TaxID=2788943 RepID=UPI0018A9AE06|nr:hypothetical protein [Aliikangiella sp. G2MR2-5]